MSPYKRLAQFVLAGAKDPGAVVGIVLGRENGIGTILHMLHEEARTAGMESTGAGAIARITFRNGAKVYLFANGRAEKLKGFEFSRIAVVGSFENWEETRAAVNAQLKRGDKTFAGF